ncbi:hypothetical protein GCM10027048_27940 [Hymenobacter coalescens]
MALDAVITAATRTEEGVVIELGPRPATTYLNGNGEVVYSPASIPGQPRLLIPGATWQPHVGDTVWGGAVAVRIESGGISFPYRREGYGKLIQDWA